MAGKTILDNKIIARSMPCLSWQCEPLQLSSPAGGTWEQSFLKLWRQANTCRTTPQALALMRVETVMAQSSL